jgi:Beta-mannanase
MLLAALLVLLLHSAALGADNITSYQNTTDGFNISLPGDWTIDDSLKGTVTRLTAPDQKAVVRIYNQPLNGISDSDYIQYSNQKILGQQYGMKVLAQNNNNVNGIKAYRLMWERPKLNNVKNDLNLYREVDLIYADRVYTLILKTDAEDFERCNQAFDQILWSFQPVRTVYEYQPVPTPVVDDIRLQGKTMQVDIPKNKMMWGIFNPLFHPNVFTPGAVENFKSYEQSLGHKFDFVMTYTEFYKPFPNKLVADTYADGRIMMLTWAPVMDSGLSTVIIPNIANGDYDTYIAEWAKQVKDVGEPVFVRIANEMNGDWDPWCAWFYSKDPDLYIEAWQRIYDIFKQQGVDNAIFVWNPHDRSFPNFKWNNAEVYYPGADYVDWVGLTGYNNGTGYPAETWRNFNEIYFSLYQDYLRKYPGKPFMITEFSCSELGGNKAAWIHDAMTYLSGYSNIRIAVWYDQTDGMRFYRIDSSPEAKEAFRLGLTNPYFLTNGVKVQTPAESQK